MRTRRSLCPIVRDESDDIATLEDFTPLLRLLRKLCIQVSKEVDPERSANGKSPMTGLCGVVSLMVQRVAGGVLMAGKVKGQRHYWNRLHDGSEVDLTSCQFGGDGWKPLAKGRKTKTPELVPIPVLMFAVDVLTLLQRESVTA